MFSRAASRLFPALLPVLLALPACATEGAAGDGAPATAAEVTGEASNDLKGGPLFDDAQFPMSAADFQKKLDDRRAKMEAFGKKPHHDGPPPGANSSEDAERKAKHEAKRAEFKAKIDATYVAANAIDGNASTGYGRQTAARRTNGLPCSSPRQRSFARSTFPRPPGRPKLRATS